MIRHRRHMAQEAREIARSDRGFTLLEVMISISVLLIAVLGFSTAMARCIAVERATREQLRAKDAARAVLESMRSNDLDAVLFKYRASDAFSVEGLDGGGMAGRVTFPQSTLTEATGLSDELLPTTLVYQDADGDGEVDAGAGAVQLLPVSIDIQWRGVNGTERLTISSLVGAR